MSSRHVSKGLVQLGNSQVDVGNEMFLSFPRSSSVDTWAVVLHRTDLFLLFFSFRGYGSFATC